MGGGVLISTFRTTQFSRGVEIRLDERRRRKLMATPPVPPDLSTCDTCRRPVPPTTNPDFANWTVVKNDQGRVSGMGCPQCRERTETDGEGG